MRSSGWCCARCPRARAGPLSIASAHRAFDPDSTIGGDLYAVTPASGSTRLVIGDVRGKGLATIGSTAIMLDAFRALAHRQLPLPELVATLKERSAGTPQGTPDRSWTSGKASSPP
ncbi:MAG TPA: SpoIIE family protein phosphatase [Trebonia sp.]|nr:SpoIIE family protein phosphatase [Trebonia sp.]